MNVMVMYDPVLDKEIKIKNKLGEKLEQELKVKTYRQLEEELIVSKSILHSIIHNKNRKYTEEILDYLYSIFHLPKDDWYYLHLSNLTYKDNIGIGYFLKKKREEKGFSRYDVIKKLKISEKTLYRIETNKNHNIDYIKKLMDLYKLSDFDRKIVYMSLKKTKNSLF